MEHQPFKEALSTLHNNQRARRLDAIDKVHQATLKYRVERYERSATATTLGDMQIRRPNDDIEEIEEIEQSTLPGRHPEYTAESCDDQEEVEDDFTSKKEDKLSRKTEQCSEETCDLQFRLDWLRRFRQEYDRNAKITIEHGKNTLGSYFRVNGYTPDGKLEFVIAEIDKANNATYVWRRDRSPTDPDTAFATDKRNALQLSCERIVHPADFDGTWDTEASEKMLEKLLETITRPVR